MPIEAKVRYGCVFCGHRQPTDAVCVNCRRDRTLDLSDSGVRELFRDTEVRAREKREGKAKMYGVLAAMATMAVFFGVEMHFGIMSRTLTGLAVTAGFAVAWATIRYYESRRARRLFPWLDSLS